MDKPFAGQVTIVTGAAQGMGFVTAEHFRNSGSAVALVDVNRDRVHEAAERLDGGGPPVDAFDADLTDPEQTEKVVSSVLNRHGRIDVLVNFAALYEPCPFDQMTHEFWHRIMLSTLDTTFNCCRAVLPHMRAARYGRIVNTSSGVVLFGGAGWSSYTTGKAGVIGFSRVLAREVGPDGVTVNVVMPGLIATEHAMETLDEAAIQATLAAQCVNRLGTSEDIAHAVAYLASREASFVTGQTLNVGGGINYL